jgi:hypothetical protein
MNPQVRFLVFALLSCACGESSTTVGSVANS